VLIAAAALILITVITSASGAWLGTRWLTPSVALTISATQIGADGVTITVFNQRLWSISGDVSYDLLDANGVTLFTAVPLVFTELPARMTRTLTLPAPPEDLLDASARVRPHVRERIAYVDAAPAASALLARIGVIEPDQPARILSASLTRADDGTAQLAADIVLVETSADAWRYRYALTVGRAEQTADDAIQIFERAYLSDFMLITLQPDEPIGATLTESLTLPDGDYAISLWLQADVGDGSYEHYAQVTYPQVFKLG